MVTQVSLSTALEAILDAIVAALQAATVTGGTLEEVQAVVRGDRTRGLPARPSLWVVPDPAQNDHTTLGLGESWTLPVTIAALVSNDDPEQGARDAVRLAALARTEVLRDRRLGLAYVLDVTSTAFDAAARTTEANRNLYWADATVTVRFKTLEV